MKKIITLIMLAFLVSACANRLSNQEWRTLVEGKIQEWQLTQIKSINTFTLNSWSSLGEKFLIIRTSPFKPYLIELNTRCLGLSFADTLLTEQSLSSTLSARFDSVSTPEYPNIKCYISKIFPLTQDQEKALQDLDNQSETDS